MPASGFLGWMAQGACHGEDLELFFPIAAGRADLPRTRAAKAICQGCAVRAQCLSYGLATRQDGIWGEPPWKSAAPSGSQPTCRGRAAPARVRSPTSPDDPGGRIWIRRYIGTDY